jgi:hypothetical protein
MAVPSFSTVRSKASVRSSMISPRLSEVGDPHRTLCAFRSPQIIKGISPTIRELKEVYKLLGKILLILGVPIYGTQDEHSCCASTMSLRRFDSLRGEVFLFRVQEV